MSKLMHYDAAKDDSYERESSAGTRDAHSERFGKPDESQQEEKGDVNPDVDAEQASCRK
jgi:hypothetical protein